MPTLYCKYLSIREISLFKVLKLKVTYLRSMLGTFVWPVIFFYFSPSTSNSLSGTRRVNCIAQFTSCMLNYWVWTKAQWSQSIKSAPLRTAQHTHTCGRRWVPCHIHWFAWIEGLIYFNVWLDVFVLACRSHMCFLAMGLGCDMFNSCTNWRTCIWGHSPPLCLPRAQWLSDQSKLDSRLSSTEKRKSKRCTNQF